MERIKSKKVKLKSRGRPPGSANKFLPARMNRERLAAVIEQLDTTPLEIMLGNMAFWYRRSESITSRFEKVLDAADFSDRDERANALRMLGELMECREKAQDCAVQAAPYVHPRLASMTIKGDENNPIPVKIRTEMNPKEAAEAYAATLGQS